MRVVGTLTTESQGGEPQPAKQRLLPGRRRRVQHPEAHGYLSGSAHAQRDRAAMRDHAVTEDGLQGMAHGVPIVEDRPEALLLGVLPDHVRFDPAGLLHDRCQRCRFTVDQTPGVPLEGGE